MILLFGLPLGSWFYLQSGREYRRDAVQELMPKDSLSNPSVEILWNGVSIKDELYGKTSCVSTDLDPSFIQVYNDQYKNSYTFQCLNHKDSVQIKGLNPSDYILIDTAGYIRNMYSNNVDDKIKLVEHTAIVIPRKKGKDIKIKPQEQ